MITPPAAALTPGDNLDVYRAAVDDALREQRDLWGEQVLQEPDGPTFDNVAPWLTPILFGDATYLTDTGVHYLVFTEPVDATTFALHVADGSQVLAEYTNHWAPPEWAVQAPPPERGANEVLIHDLFVGNDTDELFGTHQPDLCAPELRDGWLPILRNRYLDGSGTTWHRESFATLDADDKLVSYLRVRVTGGGNARVRVVSRCGETVLTECEAKLTEGEVACFRLANAVVGAPATLVAEDEYDAARERCAEYWRSVLAEGASVSVPDERVNNAWRNLVLQNSVLGERYSIGNPYETTFLMEAHGAMLALLRWGYSERATACLDRLADMTNGPGPEWYESWERGIKLSALAERARLAGSHTSIEPHLSTALGYVDDFAAQRRTDPHGLLTPERYAWDIPTVIYGWHSQATAWKGARDLLDVLASHGHPEATTERIAEVGDFRHSIELATAASVIPLDDGGMFVPVALFQDETPHESLTGTRIANYWNLVAPYALATGIVEPGSDLARGLLHYMAHHGAWLLGLTRFNGLDDPPTPIGSWREDGTGGYRTAGIDNAFGVQTLFFLADNDERDRVALTMYAKLAHGMTRATFMDGEATTVGVYRDDFYRSTWYPPNGTSNSLFLEALRLILLRELRSTDGRLTSVDLAWGAPRWWLSQGGVIAVSGLPSALGPISYRTSSEIETSGEVHVEVDAPAGASLRVNLRLPSGWRIETEDPRWDADSEFLDLGDNGARTRVSLRAAQHSPPRMAF